MELHKLHDTTKEKEMSNLLILLRSKERSDIGGRTWVGNKNTYFVSSVVGHWFT